jgi:hypothetical protein
MRAIQTLRATASAAVVLGSVVLGVQATAHVHAHPTGARVTVSADGTDTSADGGNGTGTGGNGGSTPNGNDPWD